MDTPVQGDAVNLISRGLYMIINGELGSEDIVRQRRERHQIEDAIYNCANEQYIRNTSGSRAEGLDMNTSDIDFMLWDRHMAFVETCGQFQNINSTFDVILLMDTSISSPGFALLKLIKMTGMYRKISLSFVDFCNGT